MPIRTTFSLILSACLCGGVFASQTPTSPKQQFQLAQQLATNSKSEVRYWLEQAAKQGYIPAQKQLAQDFSQGLTGLVSHPQAIYWFTSIALNDPQDNGYLLATYLENNQKNVSISELIEAWYKLSSRQNPQAEVAYNHFLEQRFNQLRAKQVSAIAELDKKAVEEQTLPPNSITELRHSLLQPLIATGTLGLIIVLGWCGYQRKKQRQINHAEKAVTHTQNLNIKVQQLELTNKQLKRQLEKVFNEFKKAKSESDIHTLELACAMFGYTPQTIPEGKMIKLRYRQLSKLYHPDVRGSDEEMKRLNQAFQIVTQNVTN